MNTSPTSLKLVAHKLCPYVQRSVITLEEKGIPYERTDIDLANKPDWFNKLSPMGKVPLLILNEKDGQQDVIFESAVICEYLDETTPGSLLPGDAKQKAQHRAWIEFGTNILNHIGKLYNAKTESEFQQIQHNMAQQLKHLDQTLKANKSTPYFQGTDFSLVDAVFAPIFRYFDVFESYVAITCFDELDVLQNWRKKLAQRPSVQKAVSENYHQALVEFVIKRGSYLGKEMLNSEIEVEMEIAIDVA